MLHACEEYYRENLNEIKLIQDFEKTYQSKNAICWYEKHSFVYKLINKALRTKDIDVLYLFRFFISDLSQALQREHQKILFSTETFLDVYRGIQLDREEFKKLKESQGKLISANGYLSTTRRKSFALQRAMKSRHRIDMVVPVLFHIRCDIKQINQYIAFADIDQFSQYPEEQEVLFDLNACFLIESIEEKLSLTTVIMSLSNKGHRSMKDYVELIQKDTNMQRSTSIIFGKLLCDLGEYDQSIKFLNLISYDSTDEDRAWIEFNSGRNFDFKEEYNEARKHYTYAYDRMMRNRPVRMKDAAYVLNNIALTLHHQNKYDGALSYHRRTLRIREKLYSSNHSNIAQSFNNIALILSDQGKYDKALHYYQRALNIQEKSCPSGDIDIAHTSNNIGVNLFDQGKFDKAFDYHQRALQIREKFYPYVHVGIAISLNNMALILAEDGRYHEAVDFHQRALKIYEKLYPSRHVNIASILNNIGACYEDYQKHDLALDYYKRSFAIYKNLVPVDHPNRLKTERNICRLTELVK